MASSRSARYAKWLSIPLGLVISALLIWQASYAAFTDTKAIEGKWRAGTVEITLDASTPLTLNFPNLAPGQTTTTSVKATYTGSLEAEVHLYAAELEDEGLAEFLDIEIYATPEVQAGQRTEYKIVERQSLLELADAYSQQNSALRANVEDGYSAELRIVGTLSEDATDAEQGKSASVTLVGAAKSLP